MDLISFAAGALAGELLVEHVRRALATVSEIRPDAVATVPKRGWCELWKNGVRDTEDELLELWARILAEQATETRTYSPKTLRVLGICTQEVLEKFVKLRQFAWNIGGRTVLVTMNPGDKAYPTLWGGGRNIEVLAEHDLVVRHKEEVFFTPRVDPKDAKSPIIVTNPLRNWRVVLTPQAEHAWAEDRIPLGNITLTLAGEELLPLCITNPTNEAILAGESDEEDILNVTDWLGYWNGLKAREEKGRWSGDRVGPWSSLDLPHPGIGPRYGDTYTCRADDGWKWEVFEETRGQWRWQAKRDVQLDGSFRGRSSQYYEQDMVTCVESARAAGMPVERMERTHSGHRDAGAVDESGRCETRA